MACEPRQLYNFIQGCDISGESSYDIWKQVNGINTEDHEGFLEFIRSGPTGSQGKPGINGKSAYEIWAELDENIGKTEEDFLNEIKGASLEFLEKANQYTDKKISELELDNKIIFKTESEWESINSTIPENETICVYTDLLKFKISDGKTAIKDLKFGNLTPDEIRSLIINSSSNIDIKPNATTKAYITGVPESDSSDTLVYDNDVYITEDEGRLHVKALELGGGGVFTYNPDINAIVISFE